jgi:tetratricopeptide (TPR) repeat protein
MEPTLDELRAAFAADSTNPRAYRALVSALTNEPDGRELAELHERWAEKCTDPAEAARAWAEAGERREAMGEQPRAGRNHLKALELDPRQTLAGRAFLRLATDGRDLHRNLEHLTRWAERLQEVGASVTERAEVELAIARVHAAVPGRLDRSFEHHRAAVALDPELSSTLDESVERARTARRISDVRALLALAAETTRSPERKLAVLRELIEAQTAQPADFDGAIATLGTASALAPDELPLIEQRVTLLVQRSRRKKGTDAERADLDTAASLEVELARRLDTEPALEAVERALSLAPDHADALALLTGLVAKAPTDANRARLGKHLAARVRAAGEGASANARLVLAAWYEREGRPAEAYDTLAPLLVEAPRSEWLARGLTLAVAAGRWEDAARAAQRLHAGEAHAAHERVVLEDLLARCLAASDLDAAEHVATRLLELVRDHAGSLAALSQVHAERGDHRALRALIERRLALTSDAEARRKLLRQLVDLADGPLADPELAADAFQKLAELDPRDRALRTELLERLGRVGRYRAIADVRRWEITSLETLAERKRALDALLLLAEEHPFDAAALAAALQAYRAADPTDVDARAALVKFLRGAGQLEEAAALVRESVRAAQDSESRQAALTELADIYDVGLRQDEPARAATLQILELAQFDEAAIERLERIALRSGRSDWLVEALEHRAKVVPDDELAEVSLRLGRLYDEAPGDPEAAMRAYARVRKLRAGDTESADALLRLYEAHSRPRELAALLHDLIDETAEPEARVALLLRRARLLGDVLGDADEAADCYREVRTLREDDEALAALLDHARAADLHAELSELLATRLGQPTTPEEAIELGMERATLLLDHLGDPREAERELLAIREREPKFAPALARLGSLYLEEGNDEQLAEVTEAHLALMTHPVQRAALAKRLFGLYERALPNAERALSAARHWAQASPTDLDALRALADLLDPRTDARERMKALDARADELTRLRAEGNAEDDAALRDEALVALEDSIITSVEQLDDGGHAEARLVHALELAHDEPADVDRFVHLANTLDAKLEDDRLRRAAATFLARKATAVERPDKERLFLAAADVFGGSLGDARLAFEVMRRAIVECSDDEAILRALVDYGRAGGFEDDLDRVLAERFEASFDAKAARALQSERADLLYSRGKFSEAADAYHRLVSLEPDNEPAKVRHRECLVRAERYQDLLVTLGQALRRLGSDNASARVALLRDVANTWEGGLKDRAEALDAWRAVLAASPGDTEATAAVERLADARSRRTVAPRPSATIAPASGGSIPPPPPPATITSTRPMPPPVEAEPLDDDLLEPIDPDDE